MSQPASRKIYVSGSRPDLRVPMREVCLHGGEPPCRHTSRMGTRKSGREPGR